MENKGIDQPSSRQNNNGFFDLCSLEEQSARVASTPDPLATEKSILHVDQMVQNDQIKINLLIEDIAKKRTLEAEIRRDIMMLEDQLVRSKYAADQRLGLPTHGRLEERFGLTTPGLSLRSQIPSPAGNTESSSMVAPMLQPTDTAHVEIAFEGGNKLEETDEQSSLKNESHVHKTSPLPMGLAGLRISEVIPVTVNGKEKKKIILLPPIFYGSAPGSKEAATTPLEGAFGSNKSAATPPPESASGSKRKAATPPPVVEEDTDKRPREIPGLHKKAKLDWSCAPCGVVVLSEGDFQQHLQGKRHRRKADAIKSCSIELLPKTTSCTEYVDFDKVFPKETGVETRSKSMIEPNKPKETNQNLEMNGNHKFWCDLCSIGTNSQMIMDAHKEGKKHKKLQLRKEFNEKTTAGTKPCVELVSGMENTTTVDIVDNVSVKPGHEYKSKIENDEKDPETADQEPFDRVSREAWSSNHKVPNESKLEKDDGDSKMTEK